MAPLVGASLDLVSVPREPRGRTSQGPGTPTRESGVKKCSGNQEKSREGGERSERKGGASPSFGSWLRKRVIAHEGQGTNDSHCLP